MGIIKKQGILNSVISYIGIIIGFVNILVIQPNFLSPEEIGLIRVLFSFSSIISVFIPLGIVNITMKYFPFFKNEKGDHHGYFGLLLLFPVFGVLLTWGGLYLFEGFFRDQYANQSKLIVEFFNYIYLFSFFLGFISVLSIYCFSLFKTVFPSLLNDILIRVFSVVLISLYYLKVFSFEVFVSLFVGIYGLQLILLLVYIFIIGKPSFKINWSIVREIQLSKMVAFGLTLSLATIASLGLKYLDSIMLARYLPLSLVGIYSIAAFIPNVIETPLLALEKISNSKIAFALSAQNFKEINEIYTKSSRYLLAIGGLLFLGININIDYLFTYLPEIYLKGKLVVIIISIGSLINMATGTNNAIIYNSESYRVGAILLFFLAFSAFGLNLFLIPIWGINGAAVATAISAFLFNGIKYFFILIKFKLQPFDRKSVFTILLIISSYFIHLFLPVYSNNIINIALHSLVVTAFYIIGVYRLSIVPEIFVNPKRLFGN